MRPFQCLLASLALLAGLAAVPAQAETYHTCGTLVASLPTVITTQGVYCFNKDLQTAITNGYAIDIQTNNVTIDCNNFKIGGLAGGTSSQAVGVHAGATRLNVTVRNCGIRGYKYGVFLEGGAGHLVEDNRLDNNLYTGIEVDGDNNTVRRNRVYDTGGFPSSFGYGISAQADVIDNNVSGMFATNASPTLYGIFLSGAGTNARGNEVSGLAVGTGDGFGITSTANGVSIRGNSVSASAVTVGTGIYGKGFTDTICSDNHVFKFGTGMNLCQDAGGNASN